MSLVSDVTCDMRIWIQEEISSDLDPNRCLKHGFMFILVVSDVTSSADLRAQTHHGAGVQLET
jgi:hypothetical protein